MEVIPVALAPTSGSIFKLRQIADAVGRLNNNTVARLPEPLEEDRLAKLTER
jgi:hypothetical protein